MKIGRVYLVGAGPGDEGLITLRGMELLQKADTIVYDRLGAEIFLQYAKPNCILIDAGKQPDAHTIQQEGINELLCRLAHEGKCVVRLKGGDPFLFGRGAEEAAELAKAGIAFEVVPGVSSFYSALCYAGIPVTHRGISASVHVFTGHGAKKRDLDFETIAKLKGTLVFLMAMGNLEYICNGLISQGKNKETPAAVVTWGTTAKQSEITGTIHTIVQLAKEQQIGNPAIVVIGNVATLGKEINWQKWRALFGKRILLVGRSETTAEAAAYLKEAGAQVTAWQGVDLKPNWDSIEKAVTAIAKYKWIFFTSHMGVDTLFEAMKKQHIDNRQLAGCRFFCIGEKTNEALQQHGYYADYVPKVWNSHAAAKELALFLKAGDTILFSASSLAQTELESAAARIGAICHRVTAYQTIPMKDFPPYLVDNYDAIGFFSPSQVDSLWRASENLFTNAKLFPIGQTTKQALLKHGLLPEKECTVSTGLSLAQEIVLGLSKF